MGEKRTLKFQMMMSPAEAEALDNWMHDHRVRSRAAAIRRMVNAHDELVAALEKAVQLADIASDWNLDSVEIDGTMVRTLDLRNEFRAALSRAKGEAQ